MAPEPRSQTPRLSRRAVLGGLLAGAALATIPESFASAASLPHVTTWSGHPGDVSPAVKQRATRLAEIVGTWYTAGGGSVASARQRLSAAGYDPALATHLTALLGSEPSAVVQVREAQYGGILTSTASVLTVVDQWRLSSAGAVMAGGTTLDVRLSKAIPHWRVTEVYQADPGAPAARLSGAAREVLANGRIRLPHAAHSDVVAGRIHDSVLTFLTALSASHVVDVGILRSGHPIYVFGTSRHSDHPKGRAVDIWALSNRMLVLPANHALAASGMRLAVRHGAYNVGGPVLLSGRQYFSDRTHQDHIHIGYNY